MGDDKSVTVDQLRTSNWSGSMPVLLSLAPTSLSSPTIPAPIHVLVSRHTFLHVGLQCAVLRLEKFAPPTFSFANRVVEEPDTIEDGPASDDITMIDKNPTTEERDSAEPKRYAVTYPSCWFEDEESGLPLRWQLFAGVLHDSHHCASSSSNLPWKIRLHFTNYPTSQLLDLDAGATGVLTTVERTFKHSLKQALVLQHGQNKVALNMTKQSHERIWSSIVTSKYAVYKPIQESIQTGPNNLVLIPIRIVVDTFKPLIQKRCNDHTLNLGQLLHSWLPQHFEADGNVIKPCSSKTRWTIAGVAPPFSSPIVDLWQSLSHPDTFLYIAVAT